MKNDKLQAKDFPDGPIIKFLESLNGRPANRWALDDVSIQENSVANAFPIGTPEKLILAKMRQLIRRGIVDGCGCGCRGDFTLK